MGTWAVEEKARNIHVIRVTLDRVGDSVSGLMISDAHWDNPHCQRDLLKSHLDAAKQRNAFVLSNGDWFCAMQGKWDKRSSKNDLRPEHQKADYLDALVRTSADYLKPYRKQLALWGDGNHETSIIKRHETSLTDRLVQSIRNQGDTPICKGGYSGWVVFSVRYGSTKLAPIKLHYLHGHGGGGAVTRGVIQSNRHAVYLADADIVWTGHTHDEWKVPISRVRLNQDNNAIVHTRQLHISTPGYKEEWGDGYGGWHVERGAPPKPTGGAWLTITHKDRYGIDYEITEARQPAYA